MLLKTVRERVPELEHAFSELHPYDVPAMLVLPVSAWLAAYVGWVAAAVGDANASVPAPTGTGAASPGTSDVPHASQ